MRKLFIILSASILLAITISCNSEKSLEQGKSEESSTSPVPIGDNSQNSLDWKGVYKGTLPCADCEGIETTITLKSSGTYTKTLKYIGKEDGFFVEEGKFLWNDNGSKITVSSEKSESQMYLVGENALIHLDKDGKRITGELSEKYRLEKNQTDSMLEDKRWVLIELKGKPVSFNRGMKVAFLKFEMETSTVQGNGSCNNFFGSYELREGGRITIGNTGSTMMACAEMEMEKTFLEVLGQVDNYKISDSILSFYNAKMAPFARFRQEKPE